MVANPERLHTKLKKRYGDGNIACQVADGEIYETAFPIALSHDLLRFYGK